MISLREMNLTFPIPPATSCQFIEGEPTNPICDKQVIPGYSYCPVHYVICYERPKRAVLNFYREQLAETPPRAPLPKAPIRKPRGHGRDWGWGG